MTGIASSLTKGEDGTGLIQRAALQQAAGVVLQLSRAEHDARVAAERLRITNNAIGILPNGERWKILGEEGERIWSLAADVVDATRAANSHARTVAITSSFAKILGADANTATAATVAPTGAALSGNIAINRAEKLVYTSNGTTWPLTDNYSDATNWVDVPGTTYTLKPTDRKLSFSNVAGCAVTVMPGMATNSEILGEVNGGPVSSVAGAGMPGGAQVDGGVTSASSGLVTWIFSATTNKYQFNTSAASAGAGAGAVDGGKANSSYGGTTNINGGGA